MTSTSTSIESAMALALAASGGGGIQDMEYDCESTASTSSSSSLDQEGTPYAAAADTADQSSPGGSLQLRLVHPEYVDCSSIPDDAAQEDVDQALDRARRGLDPASADSDDDGEGNTGKPSTCNKATFPTTLFDILADPELGDIISWLPHGRSWKILDSTKFNESVLSSRFNQSKYTSFVRQVNGWGFRRVTVGSEANTYYHELFLRGRVSTHMICNDSFNPVFLFTLRVCPFLCISLQAFRSDGTLTSYIPSHSPTHSNISPAF